MIPKMLSLRKFTLGVVTLKSSIEVTSIFHKFGVIFVWPKFSQMTDLFGFNARYIDDSNQRHSDA